MDMDSDHKEEAPCEDCKAFEERIAELESELTTANNRIGELEDELRDAESERDILHGYMDEIKDKSIGALDEVDS